MDHDDLRYCDCGNMLDGNGCCRRCECEPTEHRGIAHNHPSGDPKPSGQDAEVTKRLREAGKILGIPVVDHVIVGSTGAHFSFREGGDWT